MTKPTLGLRLMKSPGQGRSIGSHFGLLWLCLTSAAFAATCAATFAVTLVGCAPRKFNQGASSGKAAATHSPVPDLGAKLSSWTTAGVGAWNTGSQETWVFSYGGERKPGETPQSYLKTSQAFYEACVHKAKAAGDYIRGECDGNPAPRGYGIYFAEEPFASAVYGTTLTAIKIKPNIKYPSLVYPDSTGYFEQFNRDTIAKLWQTDVPGVRYSWGRGAFTSHALIVKDFDQLAVKDSKGDIAAWSFSKLKPQDPGTGVLLGGRPFETHPGLKCAQGQTLPQRLEAWVEHMYFMHAAAGDLKRRKLGDFRFTPAMLAKDGKSLSQYGILLAIASEVSALTPKTSLGRQSAKLFRGQFGKSCASMGHSCMETLEVYMQYAGQTEGESLDPDIKYQDKEWFAALGLIPEATVNDTSVKLKVELGKIMADTWRAKNPKGEARALEAYEMAECILKDLEPQSLAKWQHTQ